MMLELDWCGENNCWLCLTYDDEHLPQNGSLDPGQLQRFMKRIRRRYSASVRFYGVGEYGERTERPHYHIGLFGVDVKDDLRVSMITKGGRRLYRHPSWKLGNVDYAKMGLESARYMANYVTKRWCSLGAAGLRFIDPDTGEITDRHPEFSRMSLRPGIGAMGADKIGAFFLTDTGKRVIELDGDVKSVVRTDGKLFGLGRYLKARVRRSAGVQESVPVGTPREEWPVWKWLSLDRQYWESYSRYEEIENRRKVSAERARLYSSLKRSV